MKKLCIVAVVALMASMISCSGEKKANDSANDTAAQEQVAQEQAPDLVQGVSNADVEAVSKKIVAKETLTDADFGVVCDYMTAFYEDFEKNPDVTALTAKYPLLTVFKEGFASYDTSNLSPETKAKFEKMQSKKP